jgi:EmrB/QacA subfamily drug resistance transporter
MNESMYKRRWWTLGVLIVGLLVIGFDTTILTVALPTLSGELDASTTALQWIVNIYILFLAAFLLAAGAFGDKYGRKKVLFIGLILFGITSVMAGFSKSTEMLIVARAFMGVAAAIMLPLTISILPTVFPAHERGKAISIWAAGMGVGLMIGPLIGGFLLEHFAWGSIFFINLPIIFITILGVIFFVPESNDPHAPKIDWTGVILSSVGLMALVYGLTEGPENGWLSMETWIPASAGLAVLIIFVVHQHKVKHPMLDLNIFRNARFTWATVAGTMLMFVLAGLLFFITQYMDFFFDATPLESGVKLMPLLGAYVIGAVLSDVIVKKTGTKWVVVIGLIVLGIGLYFLSMLTADSTYKQLALCFIFQGLGMGLILAPSMDAVMESLSLAELGIGSAVNNALRQVGSTIGIAVLGSIISYKYEAGMADKLSGLPAEVLHHASQSIGAAKHIALKLETPVREQLLLNAGNAFLDGVQIALYISIGFIFIAMITTILFLPSRSRNDNNQK